MSNFNWISENIKASVLTDVLNWKTSKKSYEDLCNRSRQRMISESAHKSLFNAFVKETYKLANAQTNINTTVFNESMYLRYRILRDVNTKVPINTSYKGLCKMIGNVSYPEFKYWYYRFYNGQQELDYDRSNDPEPLFFSDLPIDIVEKIVEKSDLKSRYILRSVSQGLKSLVDSSFHRAKRIKVLVHSRAMSVFVNDIVTKFYCQKEVIFDDLTTKACRYLSAFIGNPKLQLESLDLNFFILRQEKRLFFKLFKPLSHQLHLRNLKIIDCSPQEFLNIVLCVKPKVLKKLEIKTRDEVPIIARDLVESEQWKQAEEVRIVDLIICNIAHFFHFKRFDIFLKTVSMNSLLVLRDGVSKSSNFEWCRLRIQYRPSDEKVQRGLGLKKQVHNNMEYFVYRIPNSTETLVFSFFANEVFIKKSTFTAGL